MPTRGRSMVGLVVLLEKSCLCILSLSLKSQLTAEERFEQHQSRAVFLRYDPMYLAHLAHLPSSSYQKLHYPTPRPFSPFPPGYLDPISCDTRIIRETSAESERYSEEGVGERAGRVSVGRGKAGANVFGVEDGESNVYNGEESLEEVFGETDDQLEMSNTQTHSFRE